MIRANSIQALMITAVTCLIAIAGCTLDPWYFATASLGGDVAGDRGNAEVLFINNTPHRAIFTFGSYDNLDRNTEPTLRQFSADTDTLDLEGNTESAVLNVPCARVFAIGTEGLNVRVKGNLDENDYNETALVEGVYFSSAAADSDEANDPTEGTAAGVEALIGADFECGALLIYRLEANDAGPEPFIVELTVITSESTRG